MSELIEKYPKYKFFFKKIIYKEINILREKNRSYIIVSL